MLHRIAPRIGIIGAGIGGLSAAIGLAARGCRVELFERDCDAGGKLQATSLNGALIDAGPTVFTWPEVFEALFEDAGDDFAARVGMRRAALLARHWWPDGSRLDLHAHPDDSQAAIERFANPREARGFRRFMGDAARVFALLERTYMRAPRPTLPALMARIGLHRPQALFALRPFNTLSSQLSRYFRDPRLVQLFGRYATYCGSSPFLSPATLMLIAHLEQRGVWYVEGGMRQLARALLELAQRLGCQLHTNREVLAVQCARGRASALLLADGERCEYDAIVCNADNAALSAGALGAPARRAVPRNGVSARSLSAATMCCLAQVEGWPLAHHNVFFSSDSRQEFEQLTRQRCLPSEPTVYVCAQDRQDALLSHPAPLERLFCLINAPARGDQPLSRDLEMLSCTRSILDTLKRHGLNLEQASRSVCTPAQFNQRFPATGGALYGPATHGWQASFRRPGSRSRLPGLYLTGGSTHPGPGVPMVALSGRLAAQAICQDLISTSRFPATAIAGGMSTV